MKKHVDSISMIQIRRVAAVLLENVFMKGEEKQR